MPRWIDVTYAHIVLLLTVQKNVEKQALGWIKLEKRSSELKFSQQFFQP